jgi:hypothetical protein
MTRAQVRRLKRCPAKLELLIEILNLIPPDFELQEIDCDIENIKATEDRDFSTVRALAEHDQIRARIKSLPLLFRRRVWLALDVPFDEVPTSTDLVQYFLDLQSNECLTQLEQRISTPKLAARTYRHVVSLAKAEYSFIKLWREMLLTLSRAARDTTKGEVFSSDRLPGSAYIRLNPTGIITVSRDLFSDAVDEVEASRIRECDACNRIFWAGRIDQKCCSVKCNHKRHSRRTRVRYQQGYYQGAHVSAKEKRGLKKDSGDSKKE